MPCRAAHCDLTARRCRLKSASAARDTEEGAGPRFDKATQTISSTNVYGRQNYLRTLARGPVTPSAVIVHGRCEPMLVDQS